VFRLLFFVLKAAIALFTLAVVFLVVATYLVLSGDKEAQACDLGPNAEKSQSTISSALAGEFQTKWDSLHDSLERGAPLAISFSNDEASSRATEYLKAQTGRVRDVHLCFTPGKASGSVLFDEFAGRTGSLRFRGSLDLSGDHPHLHLDSLKAGKLPVLGPVKGLLEDFINDQLTGLKIDHRFDLSFDYDQITVKGSP
jgi:hypothetical protein